MACVTVPVDKSFKERLAAFLWINWSEVGREETMKKEIFERYRESGGLFKEDEQFCESIDWHPVDELPMKKEFVEKLKRISREYSKGKPITPEEFKKWCESL